MKAGPTNLPAYFNNDADFRAWVTGIHNLISAVGLTQTTDTGQINPATVTAPSSSGVSVGYEMWRFNDTLQATVPVFIKIEYGSGGATTRPGMWYQVGSGSNGSGGLLGQIGQRQTLNPNGDKSAGVQLPSFASSDGSDLALGVHLDINGPSWGWMFYVSRPRDGNGTPTNEGFTHLTCSWQNQFKMQWIPASGSIFGPSSIFPGIHPWLFNAATGGENADVCPTLMPINGNWRYTKCLATGLNDFGPLGTFDTIIFGASHTFIAFGQTVGNNNNFLPGPSTGPVLAVGFE